MSPEREQRNETEQRPQIILTVVEPSIDQAVVAIAENAGRIDGAEVRADRLGRFSSEDLRRLRVATSVPLLFTRRSDSEPRVDRGEIERVLAAGFDLADVELVEGFDYGPLLPYRDRLLLSHHDFSAVPDLGALFERMRATGIGRIKIAATPRDLGDNLRLLDLAARVPRATVIGMGEQGLYSRILAPFFGSELVFVAGDASSVAAPGQLTLERALAIYGEPGRRLDRPNAIFAVIGHPAGHSLSPSIHNAIFRREGVAAAYSILDVERFDEAFELLRSDSPFAPSGLSVTAPFKEDAFRLVTAAGGTLSGRASFCKAVNTMTIDRETGAIGGDLTDVDGFAAALALVPDARSAVVIGAGGTARAALFALRERGIAAAVFNRTAERGEKIAAEMGASAASLVGLRDAVADVVVNTVPAEAGVPDSLLQSARLVVDVNYAGGSPLADRARAAGVPLFDGLAFLEAQAGRQSEMFLAVALKSEVRR